MTPCPRSSRWRISSVTSTSFDASSATTKISKLALLVSDDPHNEYLVALLAAHFEIRGVIFEPGRAQKAHLWRRHRYVDWAYRRYHRLRRRLSGHAAYRDRFFADRAVAEPDFETVEVEWINSKLAVETMARWRPDVTVVCGTSYVHKRVLAPAGRSFNIHGGCLPDFKGNHGVFFAFAEGRYEQVGASLHEVSADLDGGALVEVVRPPIYPGDDDESLYCRAEHLVMLRLVELLGMIEAGAGVPAVAQTEAGRTFRHRDRIPGSSFARGFGDASGARRSPASRLPASRPRSTPRSRPSA